MFNIVFCINKKFLIPCGILMQSILFFNRENISFHIISKDIDENDISILKSNLKEFNDFAIYLHRVNDSYDEKFIVRKGERLSVETYYRFFIPELLSPEIKKALYLDCDIICAGAFNDLFKIDIDNYLCAMCYDEKYNDITKFNRLNYNYTCGYYNAGVMLMNLDYWRRNNCCQKLIEYVIQNPYLCVCHDQDAINALYHDSIKPIHPKYNCQHAFFRIYAWEDPKNYSIDLYTSCTIEKSKWYEIKAAVTDPVFVHFSYVFKPWFKECTVPYHKLWRLFYFNSIWKDIKIKSIYTRKKRIKLFIHELLSKLKIMEKVKYPEYPEAAYIPEKELIEKLKVNQNEKYGRINI